MVNPGTFRGTRKAFLAGELPLYAAAVDGGYAGDGVALITRRYFKRYPVELPLDEEPSPEHLATVDDEAIEPDEPPLDHTELSLDEFIQQGIAREKRAALIDYRQAQIKRWLSYHFGRMRDLDPRDTGEHSPYRAILFKLTGKGYKLPRLKPPYYLWRTGHRDRINELAKLDPTISKKTAASIRDRIARDLFSQLPAEEQEGWYEMAAGQYAEEKTKYDDAMHGPPSTRPEDRQQCILSLPKFAQSILDLISEATGMKASMFFGGPEPAHGGRLQMISVHSGKTTGNIKMNFGKFERQRYKKYIVPIYGNFLKNCYSVEECRARALPDNSGFDSLHTMEREEEEMEIDTIDNGLSTTVSSTASRAVSSAPSVAASDITSTSFAPSVAVPATSFVPSVVAPATSHHASAALSTTSGLTCGKDARKRPSVVTPSTTNRAPAASSATTSALTRRKGSNKRLLPSKGTTSTIGPVPRPSDASSGPGPSEGVPGILEPAAASSATSTIGPVPRPSDTSSGSGPSEGVPSILEPPAASDSGNTEGGNNPSRDDGPGNNGEGGDGKQGDEGGEGGGGGGQDNKDRGGGDDTLSPAASPISGLHPLFDLPPSPLLGFDDLPPSRFVSMEPAVAQITPSNPSSILITTAGPNNLPSRFGDVERGVIQVTPSNLPHVPITVAGPNQPFVESPLAPRKRSRPDDAEALEDVGPSTRAKRARKSSSGSAVSLPMGQNKAKKVDNPSTRKSTTATTKTTLPPPTTTSDPPWLTSAISMLEAEDLGGGWSSLVQAWLAFERKESEQSPSILNSTHRPLVIRDWIQRARSVSYRPVIKSTLDFEKSYLRWWKELQPRWRIAGSGQVAYSKVDGDWGAMRMTGRNGLLSVVAALFFWGIALKKEKKTAEEDTGWKVGMDDCLRVLNCLLEK